MTRRTTSTGCERTVAEMLRNPVTADGFGLRTMSSADAGFNPLSYHCGSIWTHDTAIVIAGLASEGHAAAAANLATGLLQAAETFDYRLPELHGGDSRHDISRPVPYPAACRPQAWSAAASVAIVHAMLGLQPDVPAGRVRLRPLAGAPLGAITAHGLRVGGRPVSAAVDRSGAATITGLPPGMIVDQSEA
jgi:glycogen debranching enzyme